MIVSRNTIIANIEVTDDKVIICANTKTKIRTSFVQTIYRQRGDFTTQFIMVGIYLYNDVGILPTMVLCLKIAVTTER